MVPEGWSEQSLGDWLVEHREKSTVPDQHEVLTSSRTGLIPQSEYYGDGRITNRDNVGFHVIPPGFITYRSRSDDGLFFFNRNDTGSTGIISHFYPVFRFPEGNDQFFLSLLNYHRHRFLGHSVGTSQKVLSMTALKKMKFSLPSFAEQRKIAEILSTWDRAIETSEALLATARTQKRALMQTLLTGKRRFPEFEGEEWKEVRLGDLVEVNPRTKPVADETEISFVKMESVSEDGRLTSPVDQEFAKSQKGFTQFQEGDVLVAKITPCFENGKGCHAIALTNGRGAGSTEFLVLRAKIAADQRFVFHIVNSIPFRGRGELNMQGSAGQRRVPPDFIRLFPVFAPQDQAARKKIADVMDTSDEEIVSYETQIQKLRTEKKALMQQLLTGKRRVVV